MRPKMNRRNFLKTIGLGAVTLSVPGCIGSFERVLSKTSGKQPNIVLIMADDMGYSDIGCYGGEIDTPNLDNLAENGIRFTQFYNGARCCPTRASLLTGLYAHQAGVGLMNGDMGLPSYQGYLNDRCITIAEVLQSAGYSTMMSGKWHVCPFDPKTRMPTHREVWPLQRGLEKYYGAIAGCGSYYNPAGLMRGNSIVKRPESPDYFYTNDISDRAVEFIKEHVDAQPDKPFFCYVAYNSPHWPLHAPEEAVAKYKGRYDIGWDALRAQRQKRMIQMGIIDNKWELTPRDSRMESWKETENKDWWARCMEVYAAQVDIMDQGIGRIVASLKKAGKLDNTVILFLSDNGGCCEVLLPHGWISKSGILDKTAPDGRPVRPGNDPSIMPGPADTFASYSIGWANASNTPFRWYKHYVHEGGIATPLIVHWPTAIKKKLKHGAITHQVGHIIDIMATCLDIAGIKYPKTYKGRAIIPLEGKTLLPIFKGKKRKGHDAVYWEHEGHRAIRKGKWKLVALNGRDWELYDLEADRTEMNDLAKEYPQKAELLKTMYEKWAERCGVKPISEVLEMHSKKEEAG